MTAKLTLSGLGKVRGNLSRAPGAYKRALGGALHMEGLQIMAKSVRLVPVDTGRLRASQYVAPPKTAMGGVFVEIGYGTDYAVPVHERTESRHTEGQQAKFLEQPVEEARAGYSDRLAARVKALAGRGFGAGL